MLGAIELHLRGPPRGRIPARRAGGTGPPRGVAAGHRLRHLRPARASGAGGRSCSASRACSPSGSCPTGWARGSAAHLPPGPDQRRAAQPAGHRGPALELLRGARRHAGRARWIGALCGLAWGWRTRDRTVAALALAAAAWALPTVARTAMGYPAVPRSSSFPPPSPACSTGSMVAVTRLASRPRGRARWRRPWSPSAPFAVSRAIGLGHRGGGATARADEVSALWRAVDQARRVAPVARLHPVIRPSGMANGLAWKLGLPRTTSPRAFSPPPASPSSPATSPRDRAAAHDRNATVIRIAAAPPWHVLLVGGARDRLLGESGRSSVPYDVGRGTCTVA